MASIDNHHHDRICHPSNLCTTINNNDQEHEQCNNYYQTTANRSSLSETPASLGRQHQQYPMLLTNQRQNFVIQNPFTVVVQQPQQLSLSPPQSQLTLANQQHTSHFYFSGN